MGDYEGALKHFIEADLQGLTEKSLAPRSIKIIAESFAIKGIHIISSYLSNELVLQQCYFAGLSLEKIPPQSTSKYAQVEWIEQIKHCYETASDLGLLYLQQQDKQHSMNAIVSTTTGINLHIQTSDDS